MRIEGNRMKNLLLKSCLGIGGKEVVSIYGAGGKTALLYRLAGELAGGAGKAVTLVTTTTKIYQPPGLPLILCRALSEAKDQLQAVPAPGGGRFSWRGFAPEGSSRGWILLAGAFDRGAAGREYSHRGRRGGKAAWLVMPLRAGFTAGFKYNYPALGLSSLGTPLSGAGSPSELFR